MLTDKPIIYVANISEQELGTPSEALPLVMKLKSRLAEENAQLLVISARVEEELSGLESEEKQMFMEELGIEQSGLDKLVQESYSLLGLISFLTAGEDEVRAWTIRRGTKAPQAAGKIHTDFERGFIKAEVIAFDALKERGATCRRPRKKAWCARRARSTSWQTETLCSSSSTYKLIFHAILLEGTCLFSSFFDRSGTGDGCICRLYLQRGFRCPS